MNPIDLEQLVDAELKRLPAPRAPRTLLPRVLTAAAAQEHHAKPARGWAVWPRPWQFAGGLIAILVFAGIWNLASFAHPFIAELMPSGGRAAAWTRSADDAATVVRVLWEVVLQPVATYVSILAISLALACGLLWTAVERLAPGGVSQR